MHKQISQKIKVETCTLLLLIKFMWLLQQHEIWSLVRKEAVFVEFSVERNFKLIPEISSIHSFLFIELF